MHGHRDYEVELDIEGNGGQEKAAEWDRQTLNLSVLKKVNQFSERAIIAAERIGCIEAYQPVPAQGAKTVIA